MATPPAVPAPPAASRTRPAAPRTSATRPVVVVSGTSSSSRASHLDGTSPSASKLAAAGAEPSHTEDVEGNETEAIVPEIDPEVLKLEDELMGSNGQVEMFKGEYGGQVVTVKKLNKLTRMNLREQVQFSREMNALAKLSHPKLVKLLGVCLSARPVLMVVEFCAGGSLYELLHNRYEMELSWSQQVKMCEDIAETMTYLHSKHFVHRDLTSLNLMLTEDLASPNDIPLVKVCDLCSAKLKDPMEDWAQMTKDVGTVAWSAPEILAGGAYDEKVDIYSFSMVLFEIICREPPFEDLDMVDIARKVRSGGRPTLEAVPPDCPGKLCDLMVACWAPCPDDRPEFANALDEIRAVHPPADQGG